MISELKINLITWLLLLCCTRPAIGCISKSGGSQRRPPRTPFYLHQTVPDIDEYSQGASGKPTVPIKYGSPAFNRLKPNINPGIVFEQTTASSGDSRKMTKVCTCAVFHVVSSMSFSLTFVYNE